MSSLTKTEKKNRSQRPPRGPIVLSFTSLLTASLVVASANATQSDAIELRAVHEIIGTENFGQLGYRIANVGDIDRDGFDDLGVSIHYARADRPSHGKVAIYSAATWERIHEVAGDESLDHLGLGIHGLADITGDGVPDFAVSAHLGGRNNGGYVRYHDGASGAAFDYAHGDSPDDQFGFLIAGIGDVDADGFPDFGVSSRNDSNSHSFAGSVRLFSGQTRLGIRTLDGRGEWHRYGSAICALGDVDGDGRDDYAVGARGAYVAGVMCGRVEVRSGASHEVLRELAGPFAGDNFGFSLASADDHDGDGVRELWIGSLHGHDQNGEATGAACLVSPTTGLQIARLTGRPNPASVPENSPGEGFGCVISPIPDVDGDKLADVAISAYKCSERYEEGGAVRIFGSRGFRLLGELEPPGRLAWFGNSAALLRRPTTIGVLAIGTPGDARIAEGTGRVSLYPIEPRP